MNLLEAVASGQRFRRRSWEDYMWLVADSGQVIRFDNVKVTSATWYPMVRDLIATDWEIDEPKISISLGLLVDACKEVHIWHQKERISLYALMDLLESAGHFHPFTQLAQNLGFFPEPKPTIECEDAD